MDEEKSDKISVSFPPELLAFVNERSASHGNRSAYIQNLVRTDKGGALDPIHKNILSAIAKKMRPEHAEELDRYLANSRQPEILAALIDAMITFVRRSEKPPEPRLCLLSSEEVTDLAIQAYNRGDIQTVEMLSRVSPDVDSTISYLIKYTPEQDGGKETIAAVKPKPNPKIHRRKQSRAGGEKSA